MDKPELIHSGDILQRLSVGDEGAFRIIYDTYWKVVYHAANRYLHAPDLAQDVVQDVFCTLWSKRDQFLHVKSLESYLVTMTHHQVYALFRKWATETRSCKTYLESQNQAASETDFSIRSQQSEDILQELVDRLPSQQKLVFKMSRDEGMTHEAIARELNLSQGTVKNHMVRALQFLRQNLAPHIGVFLLILSGMTEKMG